MLMMMAIIRNPNRWAVVFATVSDQHETNYVSPVDPRFQHGIQLLDSLALLASQSLVAWTTFALIIAVAFSGVFQCSGESNGERALDSRNFIRITKSCQKIRFIVVKRFL